MYTLFIRGAGLGDDGAGPGGGGAADRCRRNDLSSGESAGMGAQAGGAGGMQGAPHYAPTPRVGPLFVLTCLGA